MPRGPTAGHHPFSTLTRTTGPRRPVVLARADVGRREPAVCRSNARAGPCRVDRYPRTVLGPYGGPVVDHQGPDVGFRAESRPVLAPVVPVLASVGRLHAPRPVDGTRTTREAPRPWSAPCWPRAGTLDAPYWLVLADVPVLDARGAVLACPCSTPVLPCWRTIEASEPLVLAVLGCRPGPSTGISYNKQVQTCSDVLRQVQTC